MHYVILSMSLCCISQRSTREAESPGWGALGSEGLKGELEDQKGPLLGYLRKQACPAARACELGADGGIHGELLTWKVCIPASGNQGQRSQKREICGVHESRQLAPLCLPIAAFNHGDLQKVIAAVLILPSKLM